MYLHILDEAANQPSVGWCEEQVANMQKLLGVLLVLKRPVSVIELAAFIGVDNPTVRLLVESISAAVVVPDDDVTRAVQVFHPSFIDFLINHSPCSDERFVAKDLRPAHDLLLICSVASLETGRRDYEEGFTEYHMDHASIDGIKGVISVSRAALRIQLQDDKARFDTLELLG
jgi:hypothetical protein